jgi:YidC/Oxa1 family membrane protein insertase
MDNNKNFLLAMVLSLVVLGGWEFFVAKPQQLQANHAAQVLLAQQEKKEALAKMSAPHANVAAAHLDRAAALKLGGPRVPIDTPDLDGSLLLKGARFDDLRLKQYRETLDPKSPEIVLLAPSATSFPYFALFGWQPMPGSNVAVPGDTSEWKLVRGTTLTSNSPVTLEWDNGHGLVFTRTISVDSQYMFTIADQVANNSAGKVTLFPYGTVARDGVPTTTHYWVVHEGFVGVASGGAKYTKYDDLKPGESQEFDSTGGWAGITDKYWMAAAIPPQADAFHGEYKVSQSDGTKIYQSDYRLDPRTIAPGGTTTVDQRLFAGAKKVDIIRGYEDKLGIVAFHQAIDWGWFSFFTQPIFYLLDFFGHYMNFGFAIILLTVAIKLVLFPLADASYRSMSKVKKLQPEMERIKQRFADDKARQQQEMMDLYRREKANPVSGCLPTLIQIPIFFSLYKVIFVTIEMRQAPFIGWIHDLSAPDPTSFLNLFGLLPYSIPAAFPALATIPLFGSILQGLVTTVAHVGIWPVLMGITQWLQTKMNPAPTDPVQARMFAFMPLIFTMMLATFPAGLVIYWTWNNLLSVTQQYVMMRRQGVEIHLFKNLKVPAFVKRLTGGFGSRAAPGE